MIKQPSAGAETLSSKDDSEKEAAALKKDAFGTDGRADRELGNPDFYPHIHKTFKKEMIKPYYCREYVCVCTSRVSLHYY